MRASVPLDTSHPHFDCCFRARPHSASTSPQKKTKSLIFCVAAQGHSPARHGLLQRGGATSLPHPWLLHGPRHHLAPCPPSTSPITKGEACTWGGLRLGSPREACAYTPTNLSHQQEGEACACTCAWVYVGSLTSP
jgi:hypothetical protein